MGMRDILAIGAGKLTRKALRLVGKGGTNYPGRVARRIRPDLLRSLAKGVHVIIVTGTNGKTTTSRMVEQILKDNGYDYFSNKSGANLLTGITTEFMANATPSGKPRKKWAVIECDEAAFKAVGEYVDPEYVLVTNVFRDQLDRYGEVTTTLNNIRIGLSHCHRATVCLNADCSMTASLAEDIDNRILFYGVNTPIYRSRVHEASDAPYCIHCQHEYSYEYITYGHLGKYHCAHCGYTRPEPEVCVEEVLVSDGTHSEIVINTGEESATATIHLPGGYNIYNGISALCLAKALGLTTAQSAGSLADFEVGFGRMEAFDLGSAKARMILVKNPAGCNQVLNFLSNLSEPAVFVVLLNDNFADGRDVSWIWDVDFETLQTIEDKLDRIYVSGIRAYDMATRLKYAGLAREKLTVIEDYGQLLDTISAQTLPIYIMPTYTAMMDLRALLAKRFGYKDFWE